MNPFDTYGKAAELLESHTLISGRIGFQAEAEREIADDVARKLSVNGSGTLLEIGCGVGVLLAPLAMHVERAVGLDHPSCLAKFRERTVPANVELVAGEWPRSKPVGRFHRILVYSVMHYLPGAQAATEFIHHCLDALEPGGLLLLGDLPNQDMKRRFMASALGQEVHSEYTARLAASGPGNAAREAVFSGMEAVDAYLDDRFLLEAMALARSSGGESYLLPQPLTLPFAYTREDLLIRKARDSAL